MTVNMRFRDFLVKRLLADTDYLVGYDADGKYIRINRADLAASVTAGIAMPTLTVQYSANGNSWHDSYTAGDHYIRIKAGSGAWSGAIALCVSAYDIWLQQGNSGSEADFLASLRGEDGADGADGEPGADAVVNPSALRIEDIAGYDTLLQRISDALAGERSFAENVKAELQNDIDNNVKPALDAKLDKDLSNIAAASTLSDDGYIPVVTDGEVKKVKMEVVSAYTEQKNTVNRQSSAAGNAQSAGAVSGGSGSTEETFTVSIEPEDWQENDIWGYVAVVRDDRAKGVRSAFSTPGTETLAAWSESPACLVALEDGALVYANPKARPNDTLIMNVFCEK